MNTILIAKMKNYIIVGDNNFWYAYGTEKESEVKKEALKRLKEVKESLKNRSNNDDIEFSDSCLEEANMLTVFIGEKLKEILL